MSNSIMVIEVTRRQILDILEVHQQGHMTIEDLVWEQLVEQFTYFYDKMSYEQRMEYIGAISCTIWCQYKNTNQMDLPDSFTVWQRHGGAFRTKCHNNSK